MDAKHAMITIGREYGSGGSDIGKALAETLGIPFYDKEILSIAAQDSGICEALFENHDEKPVPSYLYTLARGAGDFTQPLTAEMPLNHRIFMAQFKAITQVASKGPCVIVGRCADYVLKDQPHMISIFLYADLAARIERTMKKQSIDREAAKDLVHKRDKQRQGYYNFFADGNWGHRSNYQLMFNTTGLTPQAAANTIITFIENRTIG
ncbi:MAG TPA: cytidylate kinase-like family protein [Candidatus Limiplasma sp.]|nr:cytidylate kinase-like family protein [Candidatus Limiplasma sp.]HRX09617.1 cytidylate kinase-like family protein [Candidatus Limiplasma sp.]